MDLPQPALPLPEEHCLLLEEKGKCAAPGVPWEGTEDNSRDVVHAAAAAP